MWFSFTSLMTKVVDVDVDNEERSLSKPKTREPEYSVGDDGCVSVSERE